MNYKRSLLLGLGIWTFTLIIAMLAFPFHEHQRALFESIVVVALVFVTTLASIKYFAGQKKTLSTTGYTLGLIWLAQNLFLDALVFSWGPMKMPLSEYVQDIGLTYLILLIIPTGIGSLLHRQ